LLAFDVVVTIPIVFFFFKETKQVSLEDIDLLFGERALGTLPDDLHKGGADMEVVPEKNVPVDAAVHVEDPVETTTTTHAEQPEV
jgi:hypothetical protein